ncbi:MAG: hypothetical protein PHS82_01250 [Lachnospiraceae bacterium]|nr:hypothetical protein [Lachnospiraceae bacterium]
MKKYNCKTCGAELYFDAVTQKLKCEYCGSAFDPSEYEDAPELKAAKAVDETIPEDADETDRATDDSEGELVVYKCANCGAEIITSKGTVATTCVYCNRAVVLEGNLSGEFQPDYVIPFVKQRKDVEESYAKLCKSTFLAPKLFKQESTIKKIKGMYVPFWMHSMHADAELRATGKNIKIWMAGDIEYTQVSTYQVDETAVGDFEKIPADGLAKMDDAMMDSIEPFDYNELKPFNPAYLAGYYTERFDEDADKTLPRARERAKEAMHNRMVHEIGSYESVTIDNENVRFAGEKSEYGMLPVWMMYTEYKGKKYIFGMNGQTGKMIGTIPKDYGKAALITAGVFFGSQILLMIFRLIGGLL